MNADVVARQQQLLARAGLDAMVSLSPENFAYTAGFVVPSQPLMRWRHAMATVTADGTAIVCVDMEETTVRARAPHADVRVWGEFTDDPMATLAELIGDLGLAAGRVAIELDYLSVNDHARLARLLPRVDLVAADQHLAQLRQVKTPSELELLRRLARISDRAIADAFAAGAVGALEMDLASALTRSVYLQGADAFKLMIVATGERSELPNVGPTERVLKPQDVCRVEIFSVIDGYQAGICRTAVVEQAPAEAERIWRNLVACKQLLLSTIRPGASSRAVWEAFRARFDELGLPPISFVGHGIGVHLHEEPYLGPYGDVELQPGMVLGIEPLVYRTGLGFGLQLKDMVAVTETGCELLSDVTDTDRLAVVA